MPTNFRDDPSGQLRDPDETKKPTKTFKTTKLKHAMISEQINSFYDSAKFQNLTARLPKDSEKQL